MGATEDDGDAFCPTWCVRRHGTVCGEDDWVHIGSPVAVDGTVTARLCLSVGPGAGDIDGPYILLGSHELTIAHARTVAETLLELADAACTSERVPRGSASSAEPVAPQGSSEEAPTLVPVHPAYLDEMP